MRHRVCWRAFEPHHINIVCANRHYTFVIMTVTFLSTNIYCAAHPSLF